MDLCVVEFEIPFLPEEEEGLYWFLIEKIPWGWEEEEKSNGCVLRIYFSELKQAEIFKKELQHLFLIESVIHKTKDVDWKTLWKRFFYPINVDEEFWILPPWEYKNFVQEPLKKIFIYPQMAFGTGHHPSTYLCLRMIVLLKRKYKIPEDFRFLDIGTGSGILSFACNFVGLKGVGIDIDKEAIKNAMFNKKLNKIDKGVCFAVGSVSCVKGEFGLILANIQANFHISYAKDIEQRLCHEGFLVLSGLISEQQEKILNLYKGLSFKVLELFNSNEWVTILFIKNG